MSKAIISVEGLGKKYFISHQGQRQRYTALRDVIAEKAKGFFRKRGERRKENGAAPDSCFSSLHPSPASHEDFWALKDVSFEVKQGEVVGIIGRNGAGKSTLLKILSRITEPTEGRVILRGRVASLLEVGTGFHPELTGRENIFLNGAILGMHRLEIKRKFDEIVAFAEVEKFLDTPVKRYSSGMYVRLAFAVAAHLEPEILIVDEVLAVGDAQFQRKCLGKMKDVAGQGRTVLFVSHNIAAVRTLCHSCILLRNGTLALTGSVDTVTGVYADIASQQTSSHTVRPSKPSGHCPVWMESVSILCNGKPHSILQMGDKIGFEVRFRSSEPIQRPLLGYLIRSSRGENAVNANNCFLPSSNYSKAVMDGIIICDLGELPLMAGSYSVSFWLCRNPRKYHHAEDVLYFTVEEKDIWGNGTLPTKSLSCLWWPTQFAFTGIPLSEEVTHTL